MAEEENMDPNRNYADLTDEELEALENGRQASGSGGEANDDNDTAQTNSGDAQTGDNATASEAQGAVAADQVQAGQDGSATGAGEQGSNADAAFKAASEKIAGVASKDGSRVLPYAALQAERRTARRQAARADEAEARAKELQQQLEDLKAGKAPTADSPDELTEAEVIQMEEEFPEYGKKLRAVFNRLQAHAATADSNAADKGAKEQEDVDDPIQEAIDQVPLLVEWQLGDAEKFERAKEIDIVLQNSRKWVGKPLHERFAEVAKMVAEEFDIPLDDQDTQAAASSSKTKTQEASHRQVIANATRQAPNTLSDFKGGVTPQTPQASFERMSPRAQVDRFASMTDAEIDAFLARSGG